MRWEGGAKRDRRTVTPRERERDVGEGDRRPDWFPCRAGRRLAGLGGMDPTGPACGRWSTDRHQDVYVYHTIARIGASAPSSDSPLQKKKSTSVLKVSNLIDVFRASIGSICFPL